ncbi:beta-lactamase/transpeptidase-like protein [Mycena latifolia]|nr:beta-lactamase/transpeptidase-like protein [Mycena latifolia]
MTGLPSHDLSYGPDDSARDVVVRMRHLRAAYELRQVNEYNNQMFITGAHVISKYSGMSYRDFAEKRILSPLRMTSSTLHPDRAFETGKFTQYFTTSRRRIPLFMPEHVADLIAGAGAVMSTVEDMTRWIKPPSTSRPPASYVGSSKGNGVVSISAYGLGWGRLSYRGHERVGHAGGAPGVDTRVHFSPNDHFGLVVLANTASYTEVIGDIANTVADHVLGLPKISPPVVNEAVPEVSTLLDILPPPLMSSEFTGTYINPGYGNFTLCSPLSHTSPQCLAVIQDFTTVMSAAGKPLCPTDLFSAWPRFWGSHLRLSHVSGYEYTAELASLYVDGYGADHSPFKNVVGTMAATFMEEEGRIVGLGLFFAQHQSWRAKKGGSVRDIADVWFEKL